MYSLAERELSKAKNQKEKLNGQINQRAMALLQQAEKTQDVSEVICCFTKSSVSFFWTFGHVPKSSGKCLGTNCEANGRGGRAGQTKGDY